LSFISDIHQCSLPNYSIPSSLL